MLSRVANSLYWMARYIERADNIARLVEVNLQLLLDLHDLDEKKLAEYWLPIVQATGDETAFFQLHKKATGQAVTEFLVFQPENPNSIVQCVCAARENARMVRDQLTQELWEELNRLYLFVRSPQAREIWRRSAGEFFQEIKSGSLHLIGIINATLVHDEGWWFVQTGQFLERADKTTRILDVRYQSLPERGVPVEVNQNTTLEWSAVLRSCSAWDAYRTIHGADVHPRLVAEFLLLNDNFPRSVRFCVDELNRAVRRISGVAEGHFCNDAEKLTGRFLAELQFSTIDEIFEIGLHRYLDEAQVKLNQIGEELFRAYIFQPFQNPDEELMIQQEEQQQQARYGGPVHGYFGEKDIQTRGCIVHQQNSQMLLPLPQGEGRGENSPKASRLAPLNRPVPTTLSSTREDRLLFPLRSHSDGRGEGQDEVRVSPSLDVRCSMLDVRCFPVHGEGEECVRGRAAVPLLETRDKTDSPSGGISSVPLTLARSRGEREPAFARKLRPGRKQAATLPFIRK